MRRVCTRIVVPVLVRREQLAREALSNYPMPIAFGADASRIESVPGSATAPKFFGADPTTRLLRLPSTQGAEDLRRSHADVSNGEVEKLTGRLEAQIKRRGSILSSRTLWVWNVNYP